MLENNRGLELDNESRVEVLINKETREYSDLLNEMCYPYMIVFGGEPYNEGALHENGSQIPLSEYADYIVESSYFQKDFDGDFELHRVKRENHDTRSLLTLLKWANDHSEKDNLLDEVHEISGGYRPYYSHASVLTRFTSDLEPSNGLTPIVSYCGDKEYLVSGVLTGMVTNREGFCRVVENTPYLMRSHPDILEQVEGFLDQFEGTDKLLLESEGFLIKERRGRENGNLWPKMFNNVRGEAKRMGVKYSSGFTSKDGKYYERAIERNLITHEFITRPTYGEPMIFFLSTLTD